MSTSKCNTNDIKQDYMKNTSILRNLNPFDVTKEDQCLACMKTLAATTNASTRELREEDLIPTVLSYLVHRWSSNDVEAQIFTDAARFLRNVTACSAAAQDDILMLPPLIDVVISRLLTLTNWLTGKDHPEHKERELVQTRCGIQFLGNLVTGHKGAQRDIFPRVVPLFSLWLDVSDMLIRRYSTMLIYNCLLGQENHRDRLLEHPLAPQILDFLLNCLMRDESEWGLYVLIELNSSPTFLGRFYSLMSKTQRNFLIDFLDVQLSKTEENPDFPSIDFLVKLFQTNADYVFASSGTNSGNDSKIEHTQMLKILHTLAKTSANERYQNKLQAAPALLCTALYLLRGIHLAGRSGDPAFAPVVNSDLTRPPQLTDDPVHGIKCDLIRLIANLCFKDRINQDKVREFDGIPLLMDCCKLDSRNPYIMQWVIYAVRNLTENNHENQELIGQLKRLSIEPTSSIPGTMASSEVVRETPFEVGEREGAVGSSTRHQQTLEEFRQLFQ